ncbi:hypothetical protein MCUN1_000485 [Malassezia cuniculi]|uniref:AD domain-containing protein n=1 Tax=Malassezia cuniculi TaxID=948313 RepID=A0AAF0J4Q4_9BASI|nr:hypothetical protein MCUN1_000485 [Malassezia cuniculi]
MSEPTLETLDSFAGAQLRLTVAHSSFEAPEYGAQTETIVGRLWAYEPSQQLVVLETENKSALPQMMQRAAAAAVYAPATLSTTAGAHTPKNGGSYTGFKIVHASSIKNIALVEKGDAQKLSRVVAVDPAARTAREAYAVRKSMEKAERTGADVSELGQAVFDALSKTLPCRWHGTHIIVLDEVVVSGPEYDSERTYVPGLERAQVEALNNGEDVAVPNVERASAKARVWQRVVKVLDGERARLLL